MSPLPPPTYAAEADVLVLPARCVRDGDLPRICVLTGKPVDRMYQVAHVGDVRGFLPLDVHVYEMYVLKVLGAWLLLTPTIIVVLLGLVLDRLVPTVLGLAGCALALAVLRRTQRSLGLFCPWKGYVGFRGAHPLFVEASRAGRPAGQRPYADERLAAALK